MVSNELMSFDIGEDWFHKKGILLDSNGHSQTYHFKYETDGSVFVKQTSEIDIRS